MSPCRLCGSATALFAESQILGHPATYARCTQCGSVQVEAPSWLDEAYSSAISEHDVGLVDRGFIASELIGTILMLEGRKSSAGLDWGGGTGLFTRRMRDLGFPTLHYDPMAENIHAINFSTDEPTDASWVSLLECLEHLEHPQALLAPYVQSADYLFVLTELVSDPAPLPGQWWYYLPETGQHITFATAAGIKAFASGLGFRHVFTLGNLHVLSRSPLRRSTRTLMGNRIGRKLARESATEFVLRRQSLITKDSGLR